MQYITTLDDIAPLADQITIRGNKIVPIKPLELNEIGALIYKYQSLRAAFGGGKSDAESELATSLYEVIISSGADVVRDFVDAATGIPGFGARLNGVEQGNIVLSCLNMTIPSSEEEVSDFLAQIKVFADKAKTLIKAKQS